MTDGGWPLVSVVFLAFNRREALATSLGHVLALDYPADRLEVIVVDNASTDGTAEMVRQDFPDVKLIDLPRNVGVSGINAGVRAARGRFVLLLDDDCHISGDALLRAVDAAETHGAGLVSFRVLSPAGTVFNDVYDTGLLTFWGCAALLRREAAELLGGYDAEIFFLGNELEFTARLLDAGFAHLFLPDVEVVHRKEPYLPQDSYNLRAMRPNFRHWGYFAGKLLAPRDAAAVLAHLLLRTVFDAYRFEPVALRAVPEVVRGFARGLVRRGPVRPEVSTLYRRFCRDFANPAAFALGPVGRLRRRLDPERVEREHAAMCDALLAPSAVFYPARATLLRL